MRKYNTFFTLNQLLDLKNTFTFIDARYGGLVIGRRHSSGGIKALKPLYDGTYGLIELEGGEFLTCATLVTYQRSFLEQINNYMNDEEGLPDDPPAGLFHVIRQTSPLSILVLSEYDQFIVNRSATLKHLTELDSLNRQYVIREIQSKLHNYNPIFDKQ